jgi:hypothetical protein
MKKTRLVLGSGGNFHGEQYVHLDYVESLSTDVVHDLESGELPFEDNRFARVVARNILEHLSQEAYFDIIEEIKRVSVDGAVVIISGPHYLNHNAAASDHYRAFSETSLDVFTYDHEYTSKLPDVFHGVDVRYRWSSRKWINWARKIVPDELLAKHVPNAVEEIEFEAVVKGEDK